MATIRSRQIDVLLNSVAIDAASSAMTINYKQVDDDYEELLQKSLILVFYKIFEPIFETFYRNFFSLFSNFMRDENWPVEAGLRSMQSGTRLFLVNLSRGMCIKNGNGVARARETKNLDKFTLEASLKLSNTFSSLRCDGSVLETTSSKPVEPSPTTTCRKKK